MCNNYIFYYITYYPRKHIFIYPYVQIFYWDFMRQRNIKLDKNGIKVVNFFMQNRESELTADEVSRKFKIDEVDAGIILNSLEKAGFLKGEGRGLNYYYKVSDDVLATQINQSENAQEGNDDDTTRYIG